MSDDPKSIRRPRALGGGQTGRRRTRFKLKRLIPRSLLARSLLIIIMPLILLQGISTWAFYDRHYQSITRRLSQAVAGEIASVIDVLERDSRTMTNVQMFALADAHMWLNMRLLPDQELKQVENNFWPSVLDSRLTHALREQLWHPYVVDSQSLTHYVEIQVDLGDSVLQVLVPRRRLFSSTIYIFLLWMFGSSLVLSVTATLFMRHEVRPIRRLAKAADNFGRGVDVTGFRPEGATEVRLAGTAFLQMQDRIKRQIQQRTDMLAGVSHDLRTPLTRMKLELAMLGDDAATESMRADIQQMERMIEGYLAFARGEGSENPQECDISEILRQVVDEARRDGAQVDLHIEHSMPTVARKEALRRCLANLISNARRYGGNISITGQWYRKGVQILIDDDGPGIPSERREDVFRPFYRLDSSRNPETGGTGLGLTIARDMIRSQGGDLKLEGAPGGGLRANIWLPG